MYNIRLTVNNHEFMRKQLFTYDLLITVGAGSAGAVVTNRLSKNNKVLLLEAGGDPVFYNSIPFIAVGLLGNPEYDWKYQTVPQKDSHLAMNENRSSWPRGKLLGGSSNLNYMLYVRGNPKDYDDWAKVTGDDSWSYENLLPFFKKSMNYKGDYRDNGI
jgi:choline dehydrogenase-like flavoprotein